jgi:hypothetical protein
MTGQEAVARPALAGLRWPDATTALAMCYSSQTIAEHRQFVRKYGAILSLKQYVDIFWRRSHETDSKIRIPKAMEAGFANPENDGEREVKALIDQFTEQEAARLEQELFKQRRRLANAERTLQTKTTKAATESKRIATDKVDWTLGKLADLRRTEPKDRDSRIFPGWYVPILIMQEGRRVVVPMRYGCRPAGKPAFYDTKYPGTYNARRDNLEGFWKAQFGRHHGIMLGPPATWCWNSSRGRSRRCWWRACGRTGRRPASRTCGLAPPSPTSPRRKWRPPATTAASSPSSPSTSTPGCSRTAPSWQTSTPSWTTANGPTTSTAWRHRRP